MRVTANPKFMSLCVLQGLLYSYKKRSSAAFITQVHNRTIFTKPTSDQKQETIST